MPRRNKQNPPLGTQCCALRSHYSGGTTGTRCSRLTKPCSDCRTRPPFACQAHGIVETRTLTVVDSGQCSDDKLMQMLRFSCSIGYRDFCVASRGAERYLLAQLSICEAHRGILGRRPKGLRGFRDIGCNRHLAFETTTRFSCPKLEALALSSPPQHASYSQPAAAVKPLGTTTIPEPRGKAVRPAQARLAAKRQVAHPTLEVRHRRRPAKRRSVAMVVRQTAAQPRHQSQAAHLKGVHRHSPVWPTLGAQQVQAGALPMRQRPAAVPQAEDRRARLPQVERLFLVALPR